MTESTFECSLSDYADVVEKGLAALNLPVSRREDTIFVPVPRGVNAAEHQAALTAISQAIIAAFDSDLIQ